MSTTGAGVNVGKVTKAVKKRVADRHILVAEKNMGEISIGGGYSSYSGLYSNILSAASFVDECSSVCRLLLGAVGYGIPLGKSSSSSEKTKSEWVMQSFTTPSYLKSEGKRTYACLQTTMLIMDEADKLLSAEFRPSLESKLLMYSATFPVTAKAFNDHRYMLSTSWMLFK
ncbi:hypothetical protein F2Q70_00004089 [Brassica cretica]|uniref:Uncharacterized protein n=1 Tax=Brassica cretica TaxID=69181 RepID=A0A8S9INV8_BRACR|nr:hypothetical protein F2Q70_00004089 [Brassica cretica]